MDSRGPCPDFLSDGAERCCRQINPTHLFHLNEATVLQEIQMAHRMEAAVEVESHRRRVHRSESCPVAQHQNCTEQVCRSLALSCRFLHSRGAWFSCMLRRIRQHTHEKVLQRCASTPSYMILASCGVPRVVHCEFICPWSKINGAFNSLVLSDSVL